MVGIKVLIGKSFINMAVFFVSSCRDFKVLDGMIEGLKIFFVGFQCMENSLVEVTILSFISLKPA